MSVKTLADSNVFPQSAHLPLKRREWSRPLIFGLVLFIVWAWKLHQWFYDRNAVLRPGSYPFPVYNDWDDIPTSKQLHWVRCELPLMVPGNFLCARLAVPMDYQRPLTQSSDSPQVYIALVLLPAAGHGLETGRFSESPLLLNPGGPGGVGTAFVYSNAGPIIQAAVGGNVDLIGFDPRGIGATVPSADCFTEHVTTPSPGADNVAMMRRLTWLLMAHDVGLPNGTNDAMDILAHRARAASKLCSQKDSEESGLRYMATPNVAADMKSIVDAHDDWLEENGFETAALGVEKRSSSEAAPPSTKRKLVFWGFSYGSLLGQTFASMYPDAVGRLILDGVVASNVYNTPSEWVSNMRDADSIVERFFYYCQLAEEKCALFRQGDEAKDIKARYDRVISGLRAEPLIVVSRYINMPVVIMEADIQKSFFTALYSPMRTFSIIAHILNIIYEAGDLSSLLIYPDLTPMCNADFKIPISLDESFAAVGCSDRRPKVSASLYVVESRRAKPDTTASLIA
nr:uncharacterized protein CTRU02_07054 [Colletotrichum truncatum]KAF6791870.1 hypothetical protein CTRU02_07054 [Colletotrichum truncatum]